MTSIQLESWDKFANQMSDSGIRIASVNCQVSQETSDKLSIFHYPQIILFKENKMYFYDFKSPKDTESLKQFVEIGYQTAEFKNIPKEDGFIQNGEKAIFKIIHAILNLMKSAHLSPSFLFVVFVLYLFMRFFYFKKKKQAKHKKGRHKHKHQRHKKHSNKKTKKRTYDSDSDSETLSNSSSASSDSQSLDSSDDDEKYQELERELQEKIELEIKKNK